MPDSSVDTASVLLDAAFGSAPDTFPLPIATAESSMWHRSVVLGGQGRYALARAELEHLRLSSDANLRSLAASTSASWMRQMGQHGSASRFDGVAWAAANEGMSGASSSRTAGARCDALTGLAADALGTRRLGLSRTLLDRCADEVRARSATDDLWRQRIRLNWVEAELAMSCGDGTAALRHARAASDFAADTPSTRHRIKSHLVVAAALTTSGDTVAAESAVTEVVDAATRYRLTPLLWAASMLQIALTDNEQAHVIRRACEQLLHRRGL